MFSCLLGKDLINIIYITSERDYFPSVVLMLRHRLRRCPNTNTTRAQRRWESVESYPWESYASNGIRENISQDGGVGVPSGIIGVKMGAVPVCDLEKQTKGVKISVCSLQKQTKDVKMRAVPVCNLQKQTKSVKMKFIPVCNLQKQPM